MHYVKFRILLQVNTQTNYEYASLSLVNISYIYQTKMEQVKEKDKTDPDLNTGM